MSSTYSISTPVEFTQTTDNDYINFNADGPLTSTKKRILEALLTHAPEKWKEIIEDKGKAWQAFF